MYGRARRRAGAVGLVLLGLSLLGTVAGCRIPGAAASDSSAAGRSVNGSGAPASGAPSPGAPSSGAPSSGLAASGSGAPSSPASGQPGNPGSASPPPAALAGGACLLLDFATINTTLGSQFDVAAAADKSGTYTCEVQSTAASYPDLSLAITSTDLLPTDFKSEVAPSGSKSVTKLGKIGYVLQVKAASSTGPAVEVGWLSGNDRLIVLRYTFAKGGTSADATALASKMITLARTVDATTV